MTKVYSLEQSDGWGENHHIVALFSSPEARERFLTNRDHVDTEHYAYRDASGTVISGWAAWHSYVQQAETELLHPKVGDLFLAATEDEAVDLVLELVNDLCYPMEYEVLE